MTWESECHDLLILLGLGLYFPNVESPSTNMNTLRIHGNKYINQVH